MIELSKAFGALLQNGWKPKRTIVLASWDAEEYGLVGSTEWVEEYVPWIQDANVAYINLDTAVSGSVPEFSATPDFHAIAIETAKKIVFPYHGVSNVTLYDVWTESGTGEVGVLGSGSDYTAFLHNNGISSIDLGANRGPEDPVYHYHSNYDTYHWMSTFADPGFAYHKAIGQYVALLTYYMADSEILPLEPTNYGVEMTKYLTTLESTLEDEEADVDLAELISAIEAFNSSASALSALYTDDADVTLINTKLRDYQRGFVSNGGMPGRPYFRHTVFAPGLDTGYAPVTWPGITEAVTAGNLTQARSEVTRAAVAVQRAAEILAP
jgi:N-acetylated-alpha-linked acidic dipeptidase